MDEKLERQQFLQAISLTVETEYNMPGKPESAENIDRGKIKKELERIIEDFCAKTNSAKTANINYLLQKLNEKRGVKPESKEEFNVIEEVLYSILNESENER